LIRLGHFDDVDLAMMIHTNWRREDGKAGVPASNNGRVGKTARFIGRAAHAGGAPHLGINALYAAQVALAGINAVRETFRDEDSIRVHPILTHGGSQVNVIPGERASRCTCGARARREWPTRAPESTVPSARARSPWSPGGNRDAPGPMPLLCDPTMAKHFERAARSLVGDEHYRNIPHRSGSTDMGDLSQIMPSCTRTWAGHRRRAFRGVRIVDAQLGYIQPAKALASMAIDCSPTAQRGARRDEDGHAPDDARGLPRVSSAVSPAASIFDGTADAIDPNPEAVRTPLVQPVGVASGRRVRGPAAEWALRECAQPEGLRFTKRRVAKPVRTRLPRRQPRPPRARRTLRTARRPYAREDLALSATSERTSQQAPSQGARVA
jgi:hypothetical protein